MINDNDQCQCAVWLAEKYTKDVQIGIGNSVVWQFDKILERLR
jgi:hypothetical protein